MKYVKVTAKENRHFNKIAEVTHKVGHATHVKINHAAAILFPYEFVSCTKDGEKIESVNLEGAEKVEAKSL